MPFEKAIRSINSHLGMFNLTLSKAELLTYCSGLMEPDTLIRDNIINYRGDHEQETTIQNLSKRI